MLESLHISNYALIDSIDIAFDRGLNIITGESGAGKSIILGAFGLVMGERADMSTVRDSSRKTVVEAVFDATDSPNVLHSLREADLDTDGGRVILRRELTSRGGSRAFVNDTPVNLNTLREMSLLLLDIHTQHQNLLLCDHAFQLSVLDALADNAGLLSEYRKAYHDYRKALAEYKETAEMLRRSKIEREYIAFQLDQLDNLDIHEGEQEELERERQMLSNTGDIKERMAGILDDLNGDTPLTARLAEAEDGLGSLSDILPEAPELAERLRVARVEIQDIMETLTEFDGKIVANPAALAAAEDRLSAIYTLQARHNVDTDKALVELRNKFRLQLDAIDNGADTLSTLEEKAKLAKKTAVGLARELSQRRRNVADEFSALLLERGRPLGMDNLQCRIELSQSRLSPSGMDEVEFLFAFNKNQPLVPVGKTASGGEISRVMLSLKSVIAEKMSLPTLIFDEVDTGVSGDIAAKMGRMMSEMSEHAQLITITHLPQVAARGVRHFKVFKHDVDSSTLTDILCLDDGRRRSELAMMISGSPDDEAALAAADILLGHK